MYKTDFLDIQPRELSSEASALDCRFWESVRDEQPAAREAFPDRPAAVLGNDIFNTLYRYSPRMKEEAPEQYRAKALEKLMASSEWMKLHDATMGDEELAAAGTVNLRDNLKQDPEAEQVMDALEQLEGEKEKLEALDNMAGSMSPEQIEAEKEKSEGAITALEEILDEKLSDRKTMKALRRATGETAQAVENATQIAGGWGKEIGSPQDLLLDPKLANLIKQSKMKKIMDLVGKMRAVVSAERSKRPKPGPQKVSLELGDDLSRVVSTELAMLGDPELEALFDRKYMERSLTLTKRDEKPREGKGPFIVCVDESGSMRGGKEEWAKALSMAMCQQAHAEKREFGAIAFASAGQIREILKPTPAEYLEWASSFYDGGTDFEGPLTMAQAMVGKLQDADIVFITDGACQCSPAFLAKFAEDKKARKFKVIGVQIGSDDLESLKAFSDATFKLNSSRGIDGLEAVIQEIK